MAANANAIVSVQYMRAIAVILVVYHHAFRTSVASAFDNLSYGEFGVDVFFVISGIVMWVSTSHRSIPVKTFWKNRLIRIFPLWTIALTAWIALRLIVPDRLNGADLTPVTVPLSYLLVPHFHAVFEGHIWPILVPGWTLQFELFFYFLFGCSLIFLSSNRRLAALSAAILVLVAAGMVSEFQDARLLVATDPLLIEFLAGVWIGVAFPRLQSLDPKLGFLFAGLGFLLSLLSWFFGAPEALRVIFYGVPAVLVLMGACILEPMARTHYSRLWGLLGDASYSIYLFHGIALAICAGMWTRLGLGGGAWSLLMFIPMAIAVAVAGSCVAYLVLERPLLAMFRNPVALLRRPSPGASRP